MVESVAPPRIVPACGRCHQIATVVTLGGFLTIARCDSCQWYAILDYKRP